MLRSGSSLTYARWFLHKRQTLLMFRCKGGAAPIGLCHANTCIHWNVAVWAFGIHFLVIWDLESPRLLEFGVISMSLSRKSEASVSPQYGIKAAGNNR